MQIGLRNDCVDGPDGGKAMNGWESRMVNQMTNNEENEAATAVSVLHIVGK